ncbi:SNF2 family N-terminal domain-containing protein [Radiomyces spectabilis]|uniref:SNF2 family N-terminal domain-containing protein n=1 Tax=Radiomyces spectabilis TaxID=64574 RepID=UPI00222012C2|nr:SNF2 family N-terminal domain-containing protein [Radiomyces spectabilis]KAI8364631.1 SNF2 family N-terminal domain-containing protein [Radiomyces spectabilis]
MAKSTVMGGMETFMMGVDILSSSLYPALVPLLIDMTHQQSYENVDYQLPAISGQRASRIYSERVSQQSFPSQRAARSTKKRIVYDESSEDEEDDDDDEIEEEEEDSASVLSAPSEESDFEDSDGKQRYSSKKASKKHTQSSGSSSYQTNHVFIPLGTKVFERILDYRKNAETGVDELLVKYKNTSFHHAEWIPLSKVEGEHLGKHRVKKFLQKYYRDGPEDFRENLKIDRIIDEGELTDPETGQTKIFFLVKWNGLFYDASTWESEDDVMEIDALKIEEFHIRRQIPSHKLVNSPPRPNVSTFAKYDASPKYRFDNELRSYQLEGLNWLRFCYYSHRSCILADEMGLGKTVQSVALLNDLYHSLRICGPFLIVAPLSTIPHWERAFKAWTDLNVIDYRGSVLSRNLLVETEFYYKDMQGSIIQNRYKFDVLITTYEMASAGAAQLRDIKWKCAVFDEAHRLKNKQSKVLEILKTFHLDHKLLLTGTPLQNNLDELYSLLNFMQPEIFHDERVFFAEYGSLQSAAEVEKLQALLKPIMLRRFKEDVEKSIPVKEETVIEVELTNPQKKWYRAVLEKNFSFLKKGAKSNKEMPHLRNIMMQLRKCCIHPYLLEGAEEVIVSESHAVTYQEQFNCLVQSSGKLVLIDKLLRKLIKGNHKVLIFSQFTSCLDILADYLKGRNYAHERIDGSIPGDQRQAAIDRFSTLPIEQSFVFLLCTRAGGVGINLTAADTCIIFDSDWNPQNDLQAQARCHRIGQTKPVQIYRLICRNTYEKDMFDRAGMKLGLDKAVMQRSGLEQDEGGGSKNEMNRKEIEDLLKKGAYGAMLDEEASTKFCEEDIDQILERRTTVIRHEGNEKGSVFSKATFSATEDMGVDIDDPDFWEKWAAKANIDATEAQDENDLIVYEPRRRRQVQRFGGRFTDDILSNEDNGDESDAYEDELEKSRKRDQPRPWTLSEKTKYERKLMIYGYGRWDQMKVHFPRRQEKDLKAVTRAVMRKTLPTIEKNNAEDRQLVEDIETILEDDAAEEVQGDETVPYAGATKKQITEFRSFLLQAPADYVEHIERKGRNFLLRIQMLYMIRDKIVPKDWEEAKQLPIPKVTGSPPSDWWGDNEDRDLLLGICKYGYQQYLTMRNDPEFCFYGKKFDDSRAGALEDDDTAPTHPEQNADASNKMLVDDQANDNDAQVYIWPSKADIGMRLRRIIAAFLREQANDLRKRKLLEKEQRKEDVRRARQQEKESRHAERQKAKRQHASDRWTKKSRADFLRTVLSFGVETVPNDPEIRWERFKEISGLESRTDESLNTYYYQTFVPACEEMMRLHKLEEEAAAQNNIDASTNVNGSAVVSLQTPQTDQQYGTVSRESSVGPSQASSVAPDDPTAAGDKEDNSELADLVPYDKARRALKRIAQMKKIREEVIVNPDLEAHILNARKTSGLPPWWEVPTHDKALLTGICKHGIGRNDLLINDPELAFYHIRQKVLSEEGIEDSEENEATIMDKLAWPKDLVIARRINTLCELVLRPRPPPKRRAAGGARKRKAEVASPPSTTSKSIKLTLKGPKQRTEYNSELSLSGDSTDSGEDTDTILQEATKRMRKRVNGRHPTKPLKSQSAARRPHGSFNVSSEERSSSPSSMSFSTPSAAWSHDMTHNGYHYAQHGSSSPIYDSDENVCMHSAPAHDY